MFASRTTGQVTIKDKDGTFVVAICRLSADSLDRAREIRQVQAMKQAAVMASVMSATEGVEKMISEAQDRKAAKAADPVAVKEGRYNLYDRGTVLRAGIKSWAEAGAEHAVPVETGVTDLDDKAANLLHRAILDLSIDEPDVVEAATGKDSGSSTGS